VKPLPAFIVIYSGLLSADFFLYSVGKKYGRKIFTHKRFQKIISLETLSKLEDRFNKRGILFVMLGRQIIGLRAQFMLVSGVMKVSPLKFLIADAISSIFAIILWGGIGFIGGNSLEIIRKDIKRIEYIGILTGIILLTIYLLFRHFKSRRM
jgi:membrane protein DedA with SNARE-associated domain